MPLSKHRKKHPQPVEEPTTSYKKPIGVYIIVYAGIFLMLVSTFAFMLTRINTTN